MKRLIFATLFFCLPLLLSTSTALAQDDVSRDTDPSRRPLVLEGHLGLGTPYGFLGVAADYGVLRHLALNLGGGLGGSGPLGAGMARFRLPFGSHAVSLESGLSVGRNERRDKEFMGEETKATYTWSPAVWGHVGLGFESRSGAWQWRASLGYARVLNDGQFTCSSDENRCGDEESAPRDMWQIPYVGFALGYALPI
jgi:hypothetical protein